MPRSAWLSGIGSCVSSCWKSSRGFFPGKGRDFGQKLVSDDRQRVDVRLFADQLPGSASGATYCSVPTKNPARVNRSSAVVHRIARNAKIE